MKGLGVQRGAAVLLVLPGSPAFVASLLGAMKAGAIPVLGAAASNGPALAACISACTPSLVVIHQNDLDGARETLGRALPDGGGRVIVVGGDGHAHKSFLDEMRSQSSWLAAEAVGGDSVALGAWTGASVLRFTHGELAALVDPQSDTPPDQTLPSQLTATLSMLRNFAQAEGAALP